MGKKTLPLHMRSGDITMIRRVYHYVGSQANTASDEGTDVSAEAAEPRVKRVRNRAERELFPTERLLEINPECDVSEHVFMILHASFRRILPMTALKFLDLRQQACEILPCQQKNPLENPRTNLMNTSS